MGISFRRFLDANLIERIDATLFAALNKLQFLWV